MVNSNVEIKQARSALIAKRRVLKAELRATDAAIDALDRLLNQNANVPKPGRIGSVKEAVSSILREAARDMHADEVLAMANASGLKLSSRDPKATIVTALIRLRDAGQVEALGRNRFRWSDRATHPASILARDKEKTDQEV